MLQSKEDKKTGMLAHAKKLAQSFEHKRELSPVSPAAKNA